MKNQKIEIKPSNTNTTENLDCWDVYLDGVLHFSTTIGREYLESHMIPEWLRHIEEKNDRI